MFSVICKEQLRILPEQGSQGHNDGETKVCNCLLCCLWIYSDVTAVFYFVGSIRLSCQHLAVVYNYLTCTIKMLSTSGTRMSYCNSQYNISKPGELHDLQTLICGTEYLLGTIFYPPTYNSNTDVILNCANYPVVYETKVQRSGFMTTKWLHWLSRNGIQCDLVFTLSHEL